MVDEAYLCFDYLKLVDVEGLVEQTVALQRPRNQHQNRQLHRSFCILLFKRCSIVYERLFQYHAYILFGWDAIEFGQTDQRNKLFRRNNISEHV